jgi:two-component SAPR family response regulator
MNVMVVEDNYSVAELLRVQIEERNHTVIGPIPRATEALAALQSYHVDCALLDINLGTDGFATAIAVAMDELKIPFILLTGYSEHYVRGLLPLGKFRHYPLITKPHTADQLNLALANLEARLGKGTMNGV